MTKQQIQNKIENLDYWLTNNAGHPDTPNVLKDKQELERRLAEMESNNEI